MGHLGCHYYWHSVLEPYRTVTGGTSAHLKHEIMSCESLAFDARIHADALVTLFDSQKYIRLLPKGLASLFDFDFVEHYCMRISNSMIGVDASRSLDTVNPSLGPPPIEFLCFVDAVCRSVISGH